MNVAFSRTSNHSWLLLPNLYFLPLTIISVKISVRSLCFSTGLGKPGTQCCAEDAQQTQTAPQNGLLQGTASGG